MNLANKMTLFRVILIPFFVLFMSLTQISHGFLVGLLIFAVASYTDHLDGKYAREHNLITNFGIFMDPFADKLLVTSAFIMLVSLNMIPAWVAIVMIAREFGVSGLRTLAAKDGLVIAASGLGKIKTSLQMIAVVLMLIRLVVENDPFFLSVRDWIGLNASYLLQIPTIFMGAAVIMTIYSGYDYFRKGWASIDPSK